MSKYDSQIHGVFAYFEGDEIRWHDFKEVGLDEPYYDWYYAEGRLYVIRDRIAEWYWFCYASSPKDAMEQFKEMIQMMPTATDVAVQSLEDEVEELKSENKKLEGALWKLKDAIERKTEKLINYKRLYEESLKDRESMERELAKVGKGWQK